MPLCPSSFVHQEPPQVPALRLPSFFADNMVLQRDKAPVIWGWALPHAPVRAQLAAQTRTVAADAAGRWRVSFDPLPSGGGPLSLIIQSGAHTLTVRNILIGEVWLCAGQSNMAMTLRETAADNDMAGSDPDLRFFVTAFHAPDQPADDCLGEWQASTPETAPAFSAVAWFFGRQLRRELTVPVGLILSAQGATAGECWMSRDALAQDVDLAPILHDLPSRPIDPLGWDLHLPSGLYHGRIAPLAPLRLRGVIWYQGETNAKRAWQYRKLFPLLIQDWRHAWDECLPFYFVQLANHQAPPCVPVDETWPELRESQASALRLPATGMAVAIDVGDETDIHPKNKEPVGRRLAALALARSYGRDDVDCGPLFRSATTEADRIRIAFDAIGSGLVSRDGESLRQFALAGADRRFVWADAVIDGATVIVSSPQISEPVAVRYAWANNPAGCNLANRDGFPAAPFRTDTWPGLTDQAHWTQPPPCSVVPVVPDPLPPTSVGLTGNTLLVDLAASVPRPWEQVVVNGYRYGPRQLPEGDGLRIWLPYGNERGVFYTIEGFKLTPTRPGCPASLVYEGGGAPASLVMKFRFSAPIRAFRLQLGQVQFTSDGARAFVDYGVEDTDWSPLHEIAATGHPLFPAGQEPICIHRCDTQNLRLRLQVCGSNPLHVVPTATRLKIRMGGDVAWGDAGTTFAVAQWQLWVLPSAGADGHIR